MPQLRDWQIHHPTRWTQAQGEAYCVDTTAALLVGISPTVRAVGVPAAANILLSVLFHIMRANPVWVDQVLDSMAQMSESMATIMPAPEKGRMN